MLKSQLFFMLGWQIKLLVISWPLEKAVVIEMKKTVCLWKVIIRSERERVYTSSMCSGHTDWLRTTGEISNQENSNYSFLAEKHNLLTSTQFGG